MKHQHKELFFEELYWDNDFRIENIRDIKKDYQQWETNRLVFNIENKIDSEIPKREQKIIFIVGVPRSGTTLLSQLMMQTFNLGALYNSLAKYYSVPLYGIRSQEKLIKKERSKGVIGLESTLGHSKGEVLLHESGYFWQYWLKHKGHNEPAKEALDTVDWEGLNSKLNKIATTLNGDFLVKSIVYNNYIINRLAEVFPLATFLYVKREPFFVIQSILEARKFQYGSEDNWWSIRPSFYKKLLLLKNVEQVAVQVIYTQNRIEEQLERIEDKRFVTLNYEDFVRVENLLKEIGQTFDLKENKYKRDFNILPKNIVRCDDYRKKEIINSIEFAEKYCRRNG